MRCRCGAASVARFPAPRTARGLPGSLPRAGPRTRRPAVRPATAPPGRRGQGVASREVRPEPRRNRNGADPARDVGGRQALPERARNAGRPVRNASAPRGRSADQAPRHHRAASPERGDASAWARPPRLQAPVARRGDPLRDGVTGAARPRHPAATGLPRRAAAEAPVRHGAAGTAPARRPVGDAVPGRHPSRDVARPTRHGGTGVGPPSGRSAEVHRHREAAPVRGAPRGTRLTPGPAREAGSRRGAAAPDGVTRVRPPRRPAATAIRDVATGPGSARGCVTGALPPTAAVGVGRAPAADQRMRPTQAADRGTQATQAGDREAPPTPTADHGTPAPAADQRRQPPQIVARQVWPPPGAPARHLAPGPVPHAGPPGRAQALAADVDPPTAPPGPRTAAWLPAAPVSSAGPPARPGPPAGRDRPCGGPPPGRPPAAGAAPATPARRAVIRPARPGPRAGLRAPRGGLRAGAPDGGPGGSPAVASAAAAGPGARRAPHGGLPAVRRPSASALRRSGGLRWPAPARRTR